MIEVSEETIRRRVRRTKGPRFLPPARFASATFESFEPDPRFPEQARAVEKIRSLITRPYPARSRLPWRRNGAEDDGPRGIYLDGPPGIGKTHLLAAAFRDAGAPKLFATFDEFAAVAGTLGMRQLRHLLASQRLVCIDEIDLRDPANIMLLTSLVRAMLASQTRILATANADPTAMPGTGSMAEDFGRELGEIAGAFEVLTIEGVDWREAGLAGDRRPATPEREPRVLSIEWERLARLLYDVHPMYDAAWLTELDLIRLDRLAPLPDTDRALRFVRFIDRVYDRDVALRVARIDVDVDELLAPVRDDRRFRLHYARCRSRLIELTGAAVPTPGD